MGLQITVLLADVIYVEMLQSTVPVFDKYTDTPNILFFFVVSISLLCICLLISTYTMFLYHCPEYEARNFSRTEARISRGIAKFFTAMACGYWNIDVPENTNNIAGKKKFKLMIKIHKWELRSWSNTKISTKLKIFNWDWNSMQIW